MNIFAPYADPIESAATLDDKRVIKMIVESAQIMSTIIWEKKYSSLSYIDFQKLGVYKPTHLNHPCVKWVGQSFQNLNWLYVHALALCQIYTDTYHKIHKSEAIIKRQISMITPIDFPCDKETPMVSCTGDITGGDVHENYRNCLKFKWENDKRTPTWKARNSEYYKKLRAFKEK